MRRRAVHECRYQYRSNILFRRYRGLQHPSTDTHGESAAADLVDDFAELISISPAFVGRATVPRRRFVHSWFSRTALRERCPVYAEQQIHRRSPGFPDCSRRFASWLGPSPRESALWIDSQRCGAGRSAGQGRPDPVHETCGRHARRKLGSQISSWNTRAGSPSLNLPQPIDVYGVTPSRTFTRIRHRSRLQDAGRYPACRRRSPLQQEDLPVPLAFLRRIVRPATCSAVSIRLL